MYDDLDRPPLDSTALQAALLGSDSLWSQVSVTPTTTSTNADASAAASAGAPDGAVFTTDRQTAGRGRLDRVWQAPPGSGIAVSVVLRPDQVPPARWV